MGELYRLIKKEKDLMEHLIKIIKIINLKIIKRITINQTNNKNEMNEKLKQVLLEKLIEKLK